MAQHSILRHECISRSVTVWSTNTHPSPSYQVVARVISDVPEKIKSRKQKQKFYYDRHSHELPTLREGDAVRMRLPGENEWSLGRVIGEEGPRSFWVDVNGKHYRRNRKWLRATPEEVEPTVTIQDLTERSEPGESSSADVSLPTIGTLRSDDGKL